MDINTPSSVCMCMRERKRERVAEREGETVNEVGDRMNKNE